MTTDFFSTFRNVAIAHIFIVLSSIFFSAWHGCSMRAKPLIIPVEFMIAVSGEPDSVNLTREVKPANKMETVSAQKDTVKIRTQDKKKPPLPSPSKGVKKPQEKVLTEEEIRKFLSQGAIIGNRTIIPDEVSRNMELIRKTLYGAWIEPSAAEVGKLWVDAEVEFDKEGRIIGWRLIQKSGMAIMDESVANALKSVSFINGLTPAFLEKYRRITVRFEIK